MTFEFKTPTTIISKLGCSTTAETFANLKLTGNVLFVTDATLIKLGIATKVISALETAGLNVFVFDQVEPEPKVATVRKAIAQTKTQKIDTVVGLGGGSPMDIAKIIALMLASPQPVESLYGVGNVQGDRLPLLLIPTTAGTGSEVTPVAVVTSDNGEKSPIVDPKLICDTVLLDAELTLGLPPRITAATGVDAMVHAMEAYTSGVRKNIVSDDLGLKAFKLLYENIETAVHSGRDIEARSKMLLGSMMAGLAFANATVGAVHALSYPLGASFKLPHGESNALVMIPVMRFNEAKAHPLYADLCRAVHPEALQMSAADASTYLLDKIEAMIPTLGLDTRLADYNIGAEHLDTLTDGTLFQARLLSYNYTQMEHEDIYQVFKAIL